ncbi:hypothetical protein OAA86_00290 [Rhodospirillales bacterium]|nr:hypothetical protein [Rhodospirillales bacterium]
MVELLNNSAGAVYILKRPGEPVSIYAYISLITKTLDWQPFVSLEDGVHIVFENINYWRKSPVRATSCIAEATKDWFKYLDKTTGNAK